MALAMDQHGKQLEPKKIRKSSILEVLFIFLMLSFWSLIDFGVLIIITLLT